MYVLEKVLCKSESVVFYASGTMTVWCDMAVQMELYKVAREKFV